MVFRWTDADTISPMLFDRSMDAQRTISSADGTAWLFELPSDTGSGFVELFQFTDGLAMVVFNCSWSDSHTFNVDDEGRSRMSFTLDLNISMDVGSAVIDADTPAWRNSGYSCGVPPPGAKARRHRCRLGQDLCDDRKCR